MVVFSRDKEQYDQKLDILELSYTEYQEEYSYDFCKVLDACLKEYLNIVRDIIANPSFLEKAAKSCHYMNRIVKPCIQGLHFATFPQLKSALRNNKD